MIEPDDEYDGAEQPANTEWARDLVWAAALKHIDLSQQCDGAGVVNDGRMRCGSCGWAISAHTKHAGEERGARFALFALARIGEVVWLGEGMPT